MAIKAGFGGLAGNDALIFGYDIGDLYNSYHGEPTTNLLYAGDPSLNSQITWTNSGEWTALDNDTDVDKPIIPGIDTSSLKIMSGRSITTGSQHIGCAYITSLSPSTTYTISVWFRQNRAGSNQPYFRTNINSNSLGNFLYNGNTDASTWPVNQWIRISATGTLQADENGAYLSNYIGGQVGDKVWYFAPQVEQKSHATALALGTRSSTQGLLNFRGNNTIDLSTVSFNSSGQLVFDGTNDYINIPSSSVFDTQDVTVEVIVKPYATNQNGFWFEKGAVNTQYSLFIEGSSIVWRQANQSQYSPSNNLALNQWNHVVGTFRSGERKTYLNGEVVAQDSLVYTMNTNQGNQFIGSYNSGGYHYNGEIAVVRVYNRVLIAAEISQNLNHYKRRYIGLDDITDSADGGRWHRFWWYLGYGWPAGETGAFAHSYGTVSQSSPYGFQRLPSGLTKANTELLAKDGDGNIYKWDFANDSSTAQRVWDSMTAGTQGAWADGGAFNPTVIAGAFHGVQQDTWQYRVSEGFASFLVDDDTCDCYSTLNAGHAMCGGSGWNQTYAQPDGAYLRYGVDTLNDGGCLGPIPTRRLELFYRVK